MFFYDSQIELYYCKWPQISCFPFMVISLYVFFQFIKHKGIILSYLISSHLISSYLILYDRILSHLISSHLISSHLMLPKTPKRVYYLLYILEVTKTLSVSLAFGEEIHRSPLNTPHEEPKMWIFYVSLLSVKLFSWNYIMMANVVTRNTQLTSQS